MKLLDSISPSTIITLIVGIPLGIVGMLAIWYSERDR